MPNANDKYRLVTRSDFDGLVCAALLSELDMINEIKFVHPKDMQDGTIKITNMDITANLPFVEGAHLVFDHHHSETVRIGNRDNHIIDGDAPSAAHVICRYFGGAKEFPNIDQALLDAVDKGDSAQLKMSDVTNPDGWMLLNFIMDARTGLGRFKNFKISNYNLMMQLIDLCRNKSIKEILQIPDIAERVKFYKDSQAKFIEQLKRCTKVEKNIIALDLREEDIIWPGNRFYLYTVFPDCNISMHIIWGKDKQNTVFAIGKSIFNKTSKTNVGELCLAFDGGGHEAAGTCQVDNQYSSKVHEALIARMKMDG